MGIEIERKFLVAGDGWRALVTRSATLRQGYLASGGVATVRVRTIGDERGYLTIKADGTALSRAEFEYEIPVAEARQLLRYCGGAQIEKVRHWLALGGGEWVVDEFRGRHEGLVLAEVELESATATFETPAWLGQEVTGDARYYNSRLAAQPAGGEI